jgi:hypothetical protein
MPLALTSCGLAEAVAATPQPLELWKARHWLAQSVTSRFGLLSSSPFLYPALSRFTSHGLADVLWRCCCGPGYAAASAPDLQQAVMCRTCRPHAPRSSTIRANGGTAGRYEDLTVLIAWRCICCLCFETFVAVKLICVHPVGEDIDVTGSEPKPLISSAPQHPRAAGQWYGP